MKSLSSLGIGLSFVLGFLLLALIGELYYLLWWKKRISNNNGDSSEVDGDDVSSYGVGREFFPMFCWRKRGSLGSTRALNPSVRRGGRGGVVDSNGHEENNVSSVDDYNVLKHFEENGNNSIESELMRVHNLQGPPRLLFTIKEETKEDLESQDGKSRGDRSRNRSLSEVYLEVDTPYLTPLSSPSLFTPPLTPLSSYSSHGFNPLFESSSDSEVNMARSSPPPKFKFLVDAEEKLYRKTLSKNHVQKGSEAEMVTRGPSTSPVVEEDSSFITIFVPKMQDRQSHSNSNSSQVLPLSSLPSTLKPSSKKPVVH